MCVSCASRSGAGLLASRAPLEGMVPRGGHGGGGLGTVRGPAATTTTAAAALRLRGGLREGSASPRVGPCGMQWDGVRGEQRPPAPRRAPERGND